MTELYTLVINGIALESQMTERDINILEICLYPRIHTSKIDSERKIVFFENDEPMSHISNIGKEIQKSFLTLEVAAALASKKLNEVFKDYTQTNLVNSLNLLHEEIGTHVQPKNSECPHGMSPSYYHIQQKEKKRKKKRGNYVK